MEHYSELNALPNDPVFKVEFECKNCGKNFVREFDADAHVHPAGVNKRNFVGIDEVDGNRYVVEIDHDQYPIECDNCDIDTSLYVLNREPLDDP